MLAAAYGLRPGLRSVLELRDGRAGVLPCATPAFPAARAPAGRSNCGASAAPGPRATLGFTGFLTMEAVNGLPADWGIEAASKIATGRALPRTLSFSEPEACLALHCNW